MKEIYFKVAEHSIQLIKEETEISLLPLKFFEPIFDSNVIPDITITLNGDYGIPFEGFDVDITKEDSTVFFRRADYLIEASEDYSVATISVYDDFALKHALMNLYSAYIVHHQWGLLIHSSCVIEQGGAHLFSGHSGAGKSTAAKLSLPRPLLSDEASIVKVSPNGVEVFDSPFRSEQESPEHLDPYPLKSIQLLNQSMEIERQRIGKMDAYISLIDKVFYWKHNTTDTRIVFKLLKDLVEKVPVYQLYFQKNDKFWELIS